jgi:Mn-dependent DtxR family transcriptional regulator
MTPASNAVRVFERMCDVSRGDRDVFVHCQTEIAHPLGLTDAALWRAIEILRAEGVIEVESGSRVRLTASGAERCVGYLRRQVD